MKKRDWLVLAGASVLSAALRVGQLLGGFDEGGLPMKGSLPGVLLPVVLAASAVYFVIISRTLPAQRNDSGGLPDNFRFSNMAAVTAAVSGAFLLAAGAAMSVLYSSGVSALLPAVFAVAAAFSLLYVIFALYREHTAQGVALLVPVCALVVFLIFRYRADASDPVLAHIYVEILALAVLAYGALELSAFAFRNGSARAFFPAASLSVLLALTAAAEGRSISYTLLFLGCALLALGFLAAAAFRTNEK